MIIAINGDPVEAPMPIFEREKVVIGIDSSKSNTALGISTIDGKEHYIELNGKYDGTSKEDTLFLCKKQRDALSVLFRGSKPTIVGIEDIITTDTKGKEAGISYHESRFKITAVFMSIITFFQDTFKITPELVPNQAWKAGILPEEFRKRKYAKGSLAYFQSINSPYGNCSDDVTDSICILRYLKKVHNVLDIIPITDIVVPRSKKSLAIVPVRCKVKDELVFKYNNLFTFEQNISFMSNFVHDRSAVTEVETALVPSSVLFSSCIGDFNYKENTVKLVLR